MEHSPPFSDERLVAELGWVRALARQLVSDAGLAEDVVQETWLLARERPPHTRAVRGLRRWLARVARSVAVRLLRAERARTWREREAAVAERTDDAPPDVLERATTHKILMAAVLQLEEPFRSAVLMRFVDGLEPGEIARHMEISRENARQRVSRGLALVRKRLERELGGDDLRWARALVPLCAPVRREFPWRETILMSTAVKVLVSGALVSVGWMLWSEGVRHRSSATPVLTSARADGGQQLAEEVRVATSSPTGERESVVGSRMPSVATAGNAPVAAHTFRARILDRDGRALVDATLHMPVRSDVAPARSNASGHAELAVAGEIPLDTGNLPGLLADLESDPVTDMDMLQPQTDVPVWVQLVAGAPGYAPVERFLELGDEHVHELGELRLDAIGAVMGRVLGPDQQPLADQQVRIARPVALLDRTPGRRLCGPDYPALHEEVLTDAEGRFRFDSVPEGLWSLWAGGGGFLWSASPVFRIEPGQAGPDLELVLEPLPRRNVIAGVVLRPDGTPSVGTRVQAEPGPENGSWHFMELTDELGRFSMRVLPDVIYDVTARGLGYSAIRKPLRPRTIRGVVGGGPPLELRLQERLLMEVLVSDTSGRPVREFNLSYRGEGLRQVSSVDIEDQEGRGNILVPDHPFRAFVRAEGFQKAELGLFTPEAAPRSLAVTITPLARVRGRVTAHGRALPGALVAISRMADGHNIDVMEGLPSRWDQSVYRQMKTDARGEFDLPILAQGTFALRAEHRDFAPLELGPFELDPGRGERVDFELGQGGAVAGRVLVPPGQDPAGVQVRIGRGDGRSQRAITDAAGHYRIERLMPGRYMAEASRTRIDERGGGLEPIETIVSEEEYAFPWKFEVHAGETTDYDIDLAAQDVARVVGTLRIDGRAHQLASVRILPGYHPWDDLNSPLMVERGLELGGRFVFEQQRTGPVWLVLGLGGGPLDGVVVVRRVELLRGENRVDFELESAGLGGPRPAGEASLALLAELDEETFGLLTLEDDVPFLHLTGVPAAARAWLVERQATGDPFAWKKRAELDLPAGQWTSLE
jgi:RNA polymerase sigma factor (sigma-70 family)